MYKAVDPGGLVAPTATIRVLTDGATVDRVAVHVTLALVPELHTILSSDTDELRVFIVAGTDADPVAACNAGIFASSRIFVIVFPLAVTTAPSVFPPFVRFGTLSGPIGVTSATAPAEVVLEKLGPPFRSELWAGAGTVAPPEGTGGKIGGGGINTGTIVDATTGLTPLRVPVVPKSTDKFLDAT